MTWLQLIESALRLIGAIEAGESASDIEAVDARFALNDILEEWGNERLMLTSLTHESQSVTADTGS